MTKLQEQIHVILVFKEDYETSVDAARAIEKICLEWMEKAYHDAIK